jgi:hypothetical protein
MLQVKLPAAHNVRVPAGEANGLTTYRPLWHAGIYSKEEDYGLKDSPRKVHYFGKG